MDSYRVESSRDDGKSWSIVYEGFAHNYLLKDLEVSESNLSFLFYFVPSPLHTSIRQPNTQLMLRVAAGNILGYGPPSFPVSKTTPSGSPPGF